MIAPADAAERSIADGELGPRPQRPRLVPLPRLASPTTPAPGVVVAPMGWWNRDYADGRSSQATTPQALSPLAEAPTFNDNRVEVERA